MSQDEIQVFFDLNALNSAAAEEIARLSEEAIAARGRFTLALSGGNTPRALYEVLAKDYKDIIDWKDVYLFWGDERYVLHDDPQSNYRMVKESLLDRIAIPSENVFPISTQPLEPHKAAQAYAKTLVAQCGDTPEFDLILLGLGGDGHTASLFPGMDFKSMERKLVVVTESPVEPCVRISITLDVINRAQNVFFLVAGEEKVEILKHVLKSRNKSEPPYPASRVKPQGKLKWFVDKSAATDP